MKHKHIKKFNELFDSPELKSEYEIEYLQGKLDPKDFINDKNIVKFEQDNKLQRLSNRLGVDFPIFNLFGKGDVKYSVYGKDNMYHFAVGDEWRVVLSFEILGYGNKYDVNYGKYDMGIICEKMPRQKVLKYKSGVDSLDDDKVNIVEYNNLTILECINIIKSTYLPLLKKLGIDTGPDIKFRYN